MWLVSCNDRPGTTLIMMFKEQHLHSDVGQTQCADWEHYMALCNVCLSLLFESQLKHCSDIMLQTMYFPVALWFTWTTFTTDWTLNNKTVQLVLVWFFVQFTTAYDSLSELFTEDFHYSPLFIGFCILIDVVHWIIVNVLTTVLLVLK